MSGPIDYEAEYNNRARVPEHPAIIDGWARDAEAFRRDHPPVAVRYGPGERHVIDLFEADGAAAGAATVVFIHGGYWQGLDRARFSHLARGLRAHGVNVALPGYDLCPNVSIGDIIELIRAACRALARFERLVVAGHSAGGHLAACMLATDWRSVDPALPDGFVPAAYAISGLFDLKPLIPTSLNKALGLTEPDAERWSPLSWPPPAGRRLDAVVGGDESSEFLRQSRVVVERWRGAGAATRFEAIPGANHFTVIAPLADPDSPMTRRVAELAKQ
jgi:arylformamidase